MAAKEQADKAKQEQEDQNANAKRTDKGRAANPSSGSPDELTNGKREWASHGGDVVTFGGDDDAPL